MLNFPSPFLTLAAIVGEAHLPVTDVAVAAGPVVDVFQFRACVCHFGTPSGPSTHFLLFLAMKSTFTVFSTFSWAGKSTLVPSLLTNLTSTCSETFFSASNLTWCRLGVAILESSIYRYKNIGGRSRNRVPRGGDAF